ncbi:leucine-rich repeat protein [Eggerthella timonensis]|uniref:leucine-rich repeat protein n=1 Tax=Eggerthella timonensis TaxID=1871008 RepID=UPI0011AEC6E6|nr:leucine-rich repeat protein [Eggerthella timonensis]
MPSSQAAASVPLSQDPKPAVGEMRADGLVFRVQPDGASAALVGWYGEALPADVVIPARVSSGGDPYEVRAIGLADDEGRCGPLLKGSEIESLSIPATVSEIADGALAGCDSLSRIAVSHENEAYSSFDGMLFSKDLSSLLLVPEGKEGAARIPDQTATVPASAFSRCQRLQAVQAGEGCAACSSRNGILYSKDMKALVACPPGAGGAVVVPEGVESVAPGAFAGCSVDSIAVLGEVNSIAPDAFDEAAKSAVVALPEGSDRGVWEAAGFSRFAEPASPGDTAEPEPAGPDAPEGEDPGSPRAGLSFEVLGDYTLAASWAGGEAPATIEVPAAAEVGGASYRVSAVAPAGFSNLATLESVVLPAGLSTIGDAAFAGCSSLSSVNVPDGVSSIGERAFEATALTEAWLPESVEAVGPRAFASCASLARVVALGTPDVAADALAECSGVSVYCPSGSEGAWNPGLPAAGNRVLPYAATLSAEPLALAAGETADLLEGGGLLAPEPVEASYSYPAKPLSVDADGSVAGKSEGAADVAVSLSLDGVELARASRPVEVAPGEAGAVPEPAVVSEDRPLLPSAYLAGERAAAAPISVTAPVAVTFGDGNGYDVANPADSVTSSASFKNNGDYQVRLASVSCADAGAGSVLDAKQGAPALESQDLFSIAPTSDPSKSVSFGLTDTGVVPTDKAAFAADPGSTLVCSFGLDLANAQIESSAADHGMTVKPLATVTCTFELVPGQGKESDSFYLKDVDKDLTYSLVEVKSHAEDISAKGESSEWYRQYEGYIADESAYECWTTWDGTPYEVRVIGINHDVKSDGTGKAGLTFQFKNLLNDEHSMKPVNISAGGWGSSDLRKSMNEGVIWKSVPSDLSEAIEAVQKGYGIERNQTSPDVEYSPDKLFVASYFELTGTVQGRWLSKEWLSREGSQYEYWKGKVENGLGENPRLVKGFQNTPGVPNLWWERSIYPDTDTHFFRVITDGNPSNNGSASAPGGVCPCFCL